MSATLQITLICASIMFVLLAGTFIPVALLALRHLERMTFGVELMKADLKTLLNDSHELVRNVNDLSKQAGRQMEDIGRVTHTVEQWTSRVDRLVNEVGSVVEPPVFSVARNLTLIRVGMAAFMRVMANGKKHTLKEKENEHV